MPALEIYRRDFQPSAQLARPYAVAAAGIFAADTDADAQRIFTSAQQQFTNLHRGLPGPLQPPIDDMEDYWSPREKAGVNHMLQYAIVGSPESVGAQLRAFIDATAIDEIILTGQIYDHGARLRSFEIAAELLSAKEFPRTVSGFAT